MGDNQQPAPIRPQQMRVSHDEREAVVERLNTAAAEGRLDFTELEVRLELALNAKTYAELTPLTADLPQEVPAEPLVLKGGLNGAARTGRWRVPAQITVYGGLGSAKLDFTQTECRLPEIAIEAHGQTGGVTIIIPDGWVAETSEMNDGLGGFKDKTTSERLPGTPRVRLTGNGGTSGVVIRHPNSWERRVQRRSQER
ncbi:DUF1707 SHOCT-like domain-containing protein [Nonomuraea cavernae]|uniref:DUF1707 domain-containing protein n=1 Tax=Nonomuraea cavernae TaxID=2045107 RepID=A0A917YPH2_9ACTN|nr:DUF1707 domain-containing protein [Nonomuraea cavernae]MCA2184730.1 DUF1707 domain-containing protein [Nonomuraea cavernae]GGO62929.1 hypothetical protein GCM10012289_08650 [Nonomuraea cavernae]